MDHESEFGASFIKNYNKRIRQHLSRSSNSSTGSRADRLTQSPSSSPSSSSLQSSSKPQSSKAVESGDSQQPKYNYLYSKNNRANILNVVSQISDEVTPNPGIGLSAEKISLDDGEAEYLGRGATMEVFAIDYPPHPATNPADVTEEEKGERSMQNRRRVAVKRVSREHAPVRNHALALEEDFVFLKGRDEFYARVGAMTQEIKILAREPLYGHRNIVRLYSLAWDEIPDIGLYAPLMIVELAWSQAPTLEDYFRIRNNPEQHPETKEEERSDYYSLIADIADGLSVLHHCEVLHSDLKPSNILLFPDPEKAGLVAKIGDFGFADVDRVLSRSPVGPVVSVGRGQTREWGAPEMLQSCPMEIRRLASTVPVAGDVYSFGLLMGYILLNGKSPRRLVDSGLGAVQVNEELDRLKIDDLLRDKIQKEVRMYWKNVPPQQEEKAGIVLDLIGDIVKVDPTARPSSLSDVRQKIMGYDPYMAQKHQERFRIIPFKNIFSTEIAYSNLFHSITGISNRVLDSLPPNLMAELRGLVGEKAALYEPTVHSLRRLALQRQLEKPPEKNKKTASTALDEDLGKWTVATLRTFLSWVPDIYEVIGFFSGYSFSAPHAEYDFLRTEYLQRPRIFTLIDGNDVRGVRSLLTEDPLQVNARLPDDAGGWYPIHLAACLGRSKITKLILETSSNADVDLRSAISQATPLHQAIIGRHPDIVKMLLQVGADVNVRYFIPNMPNNQLCDFSPLELAVEQCLGGVTKNDKKIIELLLCAGADFLSNSGGRGYSVVFKAVAHLELLKVFFEKIPPEDAQRLARIRNNDRETLLFPAVLRASVPTVRYLLEKGVDPRVRDVRGQRAYTRLRSTSNLGASGPGATMQFWSMALLKEVPTSEAVEQVLRLIEESAGPEGMAADDYSYSAQQVEDLQENFKSYGPTTTKYFESGKLQERMALLTGIMDNPSFATAFWLFSLDNVTILEILKNNLEKWHTKRKQGLIAQDVLPDGWANFFEELDTKSPGGFWKEFIREEEIPAFAEFMKTSTISLAEKFMDYNGSLILEKLIPTIEAMTDTRAFDVIFAGIAVIFWRLPGLSKNGFRFGLIDRLVIYQRVKQIWKALSQDEILDRLHDVAVALGIDGSIDQFARGMLVEDIDVDLATPPNAIETLQLARRYPGTTIFVTSRTFDYPPKRVLLFVYQLVFLLLPAFAFIVSCYLEFHCLRAERMLPFLLSLVWYSRILPRDWIVIDQYGNLHPNIARGIFAALELIWLRTRHPMIDMKVGEPLILALRQDARRVGIPTRLQHLQKETQWPVYRLSLRRHAERDEPIPCFAAMGDAYRKWMNGGLPRKAWCDGWWEKIDGRWERVNANGKPTWTEYTEATKQIKTILQAQGCGDVYDHFLVRREYWLNTPAQQLLSLQAVFGEKHADCLEIWQKLFLRDSSNRAWIGRSDTPSPWWNRFAIKYFFDGVWWTWDGGVMDERGY